MSEEAVRGLRVAEGSVRPEWIDFNDHMNVAYYVVAFDLAIDALWARLGITDEYIRTTRGSTFAVESHVSYRRELTEADPYFITMELMAYDEKRIHQLQRMYHADDGYLAASAEWLSLHVDLTRRKVTAWPAAVLEELSRIAEQQTAAGPAADSCGRIRVSMPIYSQYDGEGCG